MPQSPELLIDTPEDGVTRLTLNRPSALNALTLPLVADINEALNAVALDPNCRVVLLTGAGRGFCSGQDMSAAEANNHAKPGIVEKMAMQTAFAGMVQRIRRAPQAVIAAISGPVAGAGMGLALAADIRISDATARFLVAAVRIGLSAGECGISYHLPRIIGAGRAFEIMMSGRAVLAEEAERIGLVSRVVPAGEIADASLEAARALLGNSPFSVAQTKHLMWTNLEAVSLEQALALENATQILATETQDYNEATRAFVEKRPPVFKGT